MRKNKIVLIVLSLFLQTVLKAQVGGCTDVLALNYNALANQNDGSCNYAIASIAPISSFNLDSNLNETSGLINWNNSIWTHNDNSDLNLYSIDTLNGSYLQSCMLAGVLNNDWEEISQDINFIYVGDFGNNQNGNRTNLKILRIIKTSILANAPIIDTINFSYSDQNNFTATGGNNTDFDCEAFIVSTDSIYLFTKQWLSNKTSLYALCKLPGTYVANLKSTFDVQGLITGAVYLESKNLIALCGYSNLLQPFTYLLYDFNGSNYFGGNKRKIAISLPFHQVEGICSTNGLNYYFSNEYFSQPPIVTNVQKLHVFDLSVYLLNYLTSEPTHEKINNYLIYPVPANDVLTIKTDKMHLPTNYFIINELGGIVLNGKLTSEHETISITNLKSGSYIVSIGIRKQETFRIIKK